MDYRDKIKQLIQLKGPILPVQVSKAIGKETLLTSAMLSEMASKGIVKISKMKVGASPLYYLPHQAEQLLKFSSNLSDKEREVLELLQRKQVLNDSFLQPVQRVILQSLKDFAIPITVKTDVDKKLFWKWYLLPDEMAKQEIINILQPKVRKELPKEEIKEQQKTIEEAQEKRLKRVEQPVKKKKRAKKKKAAVPDDSGKRILDMFKESQANILNTFPEKSAKERDFEISFETPFGEMRALCRVVLKKRIRDVDVHAAVLQASKHHLPLVLVMDGTPTKSLMELVDKEFPGVIVKRL